MSSGKSINVLVVDDAVVVRKIISDVLAEDPMLKVVGTAANGRIALQKLTQVNPDLVTLDIEMPEMNGLETLKEIRRTHPHLPVIMFSTLTSRGASDTLDALALGASDYVTKPANVGSVGAAQQRVREDLIPKIKALCRIDPPVQPTAIEAPKPVRPATERPAPGRTEVADRTAQQVDVLAIGVSTGGPNALAALLPSLPKDLPVPVVIVQHMPPMFTKLLADRLDSQSQIHICEASGGETLTPGVVYIAPGNYHMTVERSGAHVVTALNQAPQENSCRPAVDVLFRSVARVFRDHALALVLTGMGQDGLRGAEEIRHYGGRVLAQDEATSVVWGMPGFVAQAGLAERVLPLGSIAGEIINRCARPLAMRMSRVGS
jgi:two-component system chemotaxis response regulator CheB